MVMVLMMMVRLWFRFWMVVVVMMVVMMVVVISIGFSRTTGTTMESSCSPKPLAGQSFNLHTSLASASSSSSTTSSTSPNTSSEGSVHHIELVSQPKFPLHIKPVSI